MSELTILNQIVESEKSNDDKIKNFGQSLSSELFTKFGLDRTISDNRTDN